LGPVWREEKTTYKIWLVKKKSLWTVPLRSWGERPDICVFRPEVQSRKFSRRSRKRMWLVSEGKLLKLLDNSTGPWIQNPDSQMPQSNHL
jgi:hypothetical protein